MRTRSADRGPARPRRRYSRAVPLRARVAVLSAALAMAAVATFAAVPGSPFQPILPVGAEPWGPFRWLGESLAFGALHGDTAASVGAVLLAIAAVTFVALVVAVARGTVELRTVLAFAVLAQLAVAFLPLLFSRDVYSYAAYGRIVAVHGGNPYLVTPLDISGDPIVAFVGEKWLDTPSVYGPAWSSIAALVKAPAAIPLVLLLVWLAARAEPGRRWRAVRAPLGASLAVGAIVAGPYLQTEDPTLGMLELATHAGWLAPSRFVSRLLELVAPGLPLATIARAAFALALLVGLAAVGTLVARRAGDGVSALGAGWGWALLLLMLLGPVLLPWYVAWALPVVWVLPRVPATAVAGTSVALAVSLFATEPDRVDVAFDVNLFLGHWVITPVVGALLVLAVRDLRARLRAGAGPAGDPIATVEDPPRDRPRRDADR